MKPNILFTPIDVRSMKIKNRIVMPPMETNFATREGAVTERTRNYYEARARGGVGLIIVEATFIHPSGRGRVNQLGICDDALVPDFRSLTETCHRHGARIALQIHHAGRETKSAVTGFQPAGPSETPCPVCKDIPKQMSFSDIEETAEAYALAAGRAKKAGFDAVEIHGAHGYLICAFLSPYSNKRSDIYGGGLEGRARFPLEVVQEVREAVGENFPVIYRMSAEEFVEGGLTLKETRRFAQMLEKEGVDALHVSAGNYVTANITISYMSTPRGHLVHLSEGIKSVVKIPVIAVGGIDFTIAERIVLEGKADLVATGRALIADPYWPQKVFEGRFEDVRKCVRCNHGCIDRISNQQAITCTVNPEVGAETRSVVGKPGKRKKVLIVGGGVAGMEAAAVSALRGFHVVLHEQNGEVGGQVLLGSRLSDKREFYEVVKCLKTQLGKLNIHVKLNHKSDIERIMLEKPDLVILASGATPLIPPIPGITESNSVTAYDVLAGKAITGKNVLIAGGGVVGCETALYLAGQGKNVTVVEMQDELAGDAPPDPKAHLVEEIEKKRITVLNNFKLKRVLKDRVNAELLREDLLTKFGLERTVKGIDTTVIALGSKPNTDLIKGLEDAGIQYFCIGDCDRPRKALDAIHEGFQIANAF